MAFLSHWNQKCTKYLRHSGIVALSVLFCLPSVIHELGFRIIGLPTKQWANTVIEIFISILWYHFCISYNWANSPTLIMEAALFLISWHCVSSVTSSTEQLLSFTRSFYKTLLTQIIVQQLLPFHALLFTIWFHIWIKWYKPKQKPHQKSLESSLDCGNMSVYSWLLLGIFH